MNQSQINSFIPPVSPTSKSYNTHQIQQVKLNESQIFESKTPSKKVSDEKVSIYAKINPKLSRIPQFYFPSQNSTEVIALEELTINKIFSSKNDILTLDDFNSITVDLLGFPKMLNRILFQKIDVEKTGKITKSKYLK